MWLELKQEKTNIERSTYNLLEWLGDVGGLFDGLGLFVRFMLTPIAMNRLKVELLTQVFREPASSDK